MNFSEHPPSKEWAILRYKGETLAEVWFKPEGEPFGLTFRIPRESFHIPGMKQGLTTENLLKAVGIDTQEIESWRYEDTSDSPANESNPGLKHPLPPPPQDVSHLHVNVNLKRPQQVAVASNESGESESEESEANPIKWIILASRWRTILGVEATIDNLRITMESLQAQMENSTKQTLTTEEKLHALNRDLDVWNKAKSRVHFSLPKVKEFIHRATWVTGDPERKKIGELFEDDDIEPDLSIPEMVKLSDRLENMLKDRQVLSSQGISVHQECKNVSSEVDGALRQVRSGARAKVDGLRRAARPKSKFFKDVRKLSGAD